MRLSELDLPKSQLLMLVENYVYIARNKSIFLNKLEGYTYEELAEMYNLSTVRVKEIVKECLDKISKHSESLRILMSYRRRDVRLLEVLPGP